MVLSGFLLVNMAYGQGPDVYTINADGTITPSTPLIAFSGNTYRIISNFSGSIDVYASNIIIDGNGYAVQGPGGIGIWLKEANNITIRNLAINGFSMSGIYLTNSSNDTICYNNLNSNDYCGIDLENASNNNNIFGNNLMNNYFAGIRLSNNSPIPDAGSGSEFNNIYENNITGNLQYGIFVGNSSYNKIYNNHIANNCDAGISIASSSNNEFYLNSVVSNFPNVKVGGKIDYFTGAGIGGPGANIWDNGSVGNYWSDYSGVDANHDGIGDTPYVIDAHNADMRPLTAFFGVSSSHLSSSSTEKERAQQLVQTPLVATIIGVSAALVGVSLLYNYKKRQKKIGKLKN